jgi:hypothetical protein
MIPMSCPSCGRRGNVPLDRLNTRMHCKKCDAVFHLDPTGKPILGEPPPPKGSKAAKGAKDKNEPLDPIGIVAGKLAKIPRPIWYTLGAILGGYLLYVGYTVLGPGPAPQGADLVEQNRQAAYAFLDRDLPKLQGMATLDTREDVAKLVETFRPLVGDAAAKGREGVAEPLVIPPLEAAESPKYEITFQPKPATEGGTTPPIFTLNLIWHKSGGKYYLNGYASLEANNERIKAKQEAAALAEKKKSR